MIDRELFIDSMGELDVELMREHIEWKLPTKAQKLRRYALAVAAYAAAVVMVAVILPFLIGKGDDPAPKPGDDPIVTETHSPQPEDPDLTEINAADINRVYNGVDPKDLPTNVSLDEVYDIINAAVQAYGDYDIVVLENGDRLRTLPKDPHITFAELGKDGMMTDAAMEYLEYNKNVFYVVRDALVSRFPEDARFLTSKKESGEDWLIMDVEALRENEQRNEENPHSPVSISPDTLIIYHTFVRQVSFMSIDTFVSIDNKETVLYPAERDRDILDILKFGDVGSGAMDPVATASADGLELSVFVTDPVATDPDVSYTVVLENTGDSDVTLRQGYLGDYIDEVTVYENGVLRPDKSDRSGYSEEVQTRVLKPGEYLIRHSTVSMTKEDMTPATDSSWEVEAKAEYIPNGGDGHETLTVRVSLPRETVENTVPDPDFITVGADGKTFSFDRSSEYYYYELVTRRASELLAEADMIQVYSEAAELASRRARNGAKYAELLYSETCSVYMDGTDSGLFTRILFMEDEDGQVYMILGEDGDYSAGEVYLISDAEPIIEAIMRMLGDETTTTMTAPPPSSPEETTVALPDPEPEITVEAPSAKPDEPSSDTTVREPVTEEITTTAGYEPVHTTNKPYEAYPEPYISNVRMNSVTMVLYGCEYTLVVDKNSYKAGDAITLTVTLANKGQSRLSFKDEFGTRKSFLDDIYVSPIWGSVGGEEGYSNRATLLPGDTWTHTVTLDSTGWHEGSAWKLTGRLGFYVNGRYQSEELSLAVCHEGMANTAGIYNPFACETYGKWFRGNGEIVVDMNRDTTLNWEDYLNEDYLGLELVRVTSWNSKETEEKNFAANKNYKATVSLFLENKSYLSVINAMMKLYELDRECDFIYSASPVFSGQSTPAT